MIKEYIGRTVRCGRPVSIAATCTAGVTAGADLGFYKYGCPIHLKGAPEVERRGGMESEEGLCPLPGKFLYFLYQNGGFLCIPSDIY